DDDAGRAHDGKSHEAAARNTLVLHDGDPPVGAHRTVPHSATQDKVARTMLSFDGEGCHRPTNPRQEILMHYRTLGNSTLSVSAIGLGLMSMSGVYGKGDDAESIAVVHKALDLGVNFVDSSDMYGWGQNEELLGRAIKGRRDQVVLTTKFGQVQSPDGKGNLVDGSPAYVARACDASLKRLGVDVIDLYSQHRVDPKVPIEDTVGAMSRLIEQGKVRYIGLSEAAPATIARAHAVHPISAV